MNKQKRFYISKRTDLPRLQSWVIRGAAILLALIVCAIVTMLMTGENPIGVYKTILKGAFGTSRKTWVTFQNLAILLGIAYLLLTVRVPSAGPFADPSAPAMAAIPF